MNWKTIAMIVVMTPVVALMGGLGILFYQIGQHWDARSTDSLIAGLVATCGGGAVVIGVLLAVIVGIPFAIRMFEQSGYARQGWREPVSSWPELLPTNRTPGWAERPPLIIDKQQGSWQTLDNQYDTWEEEGQPPLVDGSTRQ
jgi:hypothetical protein